jgi:hypothetical protein
MYAPRSHRLQWRYPASSGTSPPVLWSRTVALAAVLLHRTGGVKSAGYSVRAMLANSVQ